MALAPESRRPFLDAMREGWERLQPPTTLLRSIRRYYVGTVAVPPTPFHVTELATRAERTATRRAEWNEIWAWHAAAVAFDRHRPPPGRLGRAVERPAQPSKGVRQRSRAGCGRSPAPLRPS